MAIRPSSGAGAPRHQRSGGSPHLLQLTDLHLFGDPRGRLLDQDPRETLQRVFGLARRQHWPPDAILLTGDLVHDESEAGYRYLRQRIRELGAPCFCIPGNHDRKKLLAALVEPEADQPFRSVRLRDWDILLLDSTVAGEAGGHLAGATLAALDRHLHNHPARPALVCLHHQPVAVGSRWIDTMMVDNGGELLQLAAGHDNLRAILWGHIHQAYDAEHAGTRLLATPSTCVQFLPGSERFALDPRTPGYRWLTLSAQGGIESGIARIDAYPGALPQQAVGY